MIVSKPTQDALMEIIKQCFQENRHLDRLVSVLGVQFACNKSAAHIHQSMAHYFPQLSDKIGEAALERYNIAVVYGETPAGAQNYNSVMEIIEDVEKHIVDFQTMFMGVCKVALENNDINVYADLLPMLADYNRLVEQAILLADKVRFYGEDNIMSFDHDIDHFWILGE